MLYHIIITIVVVHNFNYLAVCYNIFGHLECIMFDCAQCDAVNENLTPTEKVYCEY